MNNPKTKKHRQRARCLSEALDPRCLLSADLPATTTTLQISSPIVKPDQAITLTAHVTSSDGSTPTGTVAFIDPVELSLIPGQTITAVSLNLAATGHFVFDPQPPFSVENRYSNSPIVAIPDLAANTAHSALLLGTATLDPNGNATLNVNAPSQYFSVNNHIEAVFLGADPYYVESSKYHVVDPSAFTTSAADNNLVYTFGLPVSLDVGGPGNGYIGGNLSFPNRLLDSSEQSQELTVPPDGLTFDTTYSDHQRWIAPSDVPLAIHSTDLGNGNYETTVTPVSTLPQLDGQNDSLQSSASSGITLATPLPTQMNLKKGWNWSTADGTFTNPIGLAVSFSTPDGLLESRHDISYYVPKVLDRGTDLSNSAGLTIQNTYIGASGAVSAGTLSIGGAFSPIFSPSGPFPTGTVSIYDGDALLTTQPLDSGGNLIWNPPSKSLSLGTHNLTLQYSGDASYLPSQGTISLTIVKTQTHLTLRSSQTDYYLGHKLSLTALVDAYDDVVTPTGTITFREGDTLLATMQLGDQSQISFSLPPGTHTITATYSGNEDDQYLPSTGSTSFNIINSAPPPTISSNPISTLPLLPPYTPLIPPVYEPLMPPIDWPSTPYQPLTSSTGSTDVGAPRTSAAVPAKKDTSLQIAQPSAKSKKHFPFSLVFSQSVRTGTPESTSLQIYIDGQLFDTLTSGNLATGIAPSSKPRHTLNASLDLANRLSIGSHQIYLTSNDTLNYQGAGSSVYILKIKKHGLTLKKDNDLVVARANNYFSTAATSLAVNL